MLDYEAMWFKLRHKVEESAEVESGEIHKLMQSREKGVLYRAEKPPEGVMMALMPGFINLWNELLYTAEQEVEAYPELRPWMREIEKRVLNPAGMDILDLARSFQKILRD